MKPIQDLLPELNVPKKIVITHHYNPDADALGSTLGLWHYFKMKGHDCIVISPNAMPDFILWMPKSETVLNFETQAVEASKWLDDSDYLFCLDFNHLSRTKSFAPVLEKFKGKKVMIDHHLSPDESFDFGISLSSKSSTCEMVYDFINSCGDNALINLDIAKCLYAGTMTDTGSFKFPCTTASVHAMVSDLMAKGLKTAPIHEAVYDNYNENRLRFLGFVLSKKMNLIADCHTSLIAISRTELNEYNINTGDTEGVVNFPLSLKNVIFSIFISERENEIRMSFRSKGNFNVNEFARTYFSGGGHANAAGGKSDESLEKTLEKLTNAILEHKNILQQCYEESN